MRDNSLEMQKCNSSETKLKLNKSDILTLCLCFNWAVNNEGRNVLVELEMIVLLSTTSSSFLNRSFFHSKFSGMHSCINMAPLASSLMSLVPEMQLNCCVAFSLPRRRPFASKSFNSFCVAVNAPCTALAGYHKALPDSQLRRRALTTNVQ